VARGGVGIDNIDAETAKKLDIAVINTPAASSDSVAELVIAGMFSMCRFLYDSNRQMPIKGAKEFNTFKKKYADGNIPLSEVAKDLLTFYKHGGKQIYYANSKDHKSDRLEDMITTEKIELIETAGDNDCGDACTI
jgi:phosphoglycerate dehydrogenase-like enzyme